ncbi:hypothetical protein [Nitrospira sp. Kam-Ns4a]
MHCHRCQGLMVVDHFIDMEDDSGHLWLRGWRCVACGAISEPLINRHRLAQTSGFRRLAGLRSKKRAATYEIVRLTA